MNEVAAEMNIDELRLEGESHELFDPNRSRDQSSPNWSLRHFYAVSESLSRMRCKYTFENVKDP